MSQYIQIKHSLGGTVWAFSVGPINTFKGRNVAPWRKKVEQKQ